MTCLRPHIPADPRPPAGPVDGAMADTTVRFPRRDPARPPRILLSSVFGPYGVDDEFGRRENIMELFHNQVTKAQGVASLRFHHRSFGLYFLAENINADVTVLDFPSRRRFLRELRRGYDLVGISFITPNFRKAQAMARWVRERSPDSVIILGGHGAAIEGIEKLVDCDHVVRGEGIGWLRRYLGQDPSAPIRHPDLPANDYHRVFGVPIPGVTAGLLVPGVGCSNGCRFCSTTHFFGKVYQPFFTSGKEVFDILCGMADRSGYDTFFILDENFLKERKRALELLAEMERSGRWFKFHVFASADTVSAFGAETLARLGVHMLWIGLESRTGPVFPKNAGIDHAALISDLRRHGISVLASAILCMEHHTPETLRLDIDHTIALQPDLVQFMLLTGLPTTGVYQDHKEQERLRTALPYEEWHGQKELNYTHPAFPGRAPEEWLSRAFREDYERNSSSIYRMLATAVLGYRTLAAKADGDAALRARAGQLRDRVQEYRPLLPAIGHYAVNALERERAATLEAEIAELLGPPSPKQRLYALAVRASAAWWNLRVKCFGDRVQPRTRVTRYRSGSSR
jgi:radical SAM superfamily enzyme YgiQ (UPF0313 family)